MKKNKIIGISIAVLGAIAVGSTSYALYTYTDPNKGFDITIETPEGSQGTVNYGVGKITKPASGWKFEPKTNRTFKYVVPLTATYAADVIAQDFIAGNLKVTPSGDLLSSVDVTYGLEGYTDSTYGKTTYGGLNDFAAGKDITVKIDGTQKLVINVSLKDEITDGSDVFFKIAEQTLNFKVEWTEPSSTYKAAYVVGDKTGWEEWKDYQMVENIGATDHEWCFKNLEGFTQLKIKKGNIWCGGAGGNIKPTNTTNKYQVYWKDGNAANNLSVQDNPEGINYISVSNS